MLSSIFRYKYYLLVKTLDTFFINNISLDMLLIIQTLNS